MRYLALAGLCVALAACSSPIMLRDSMGRMASCGPYPALGVSGIIGAEREKQCITDYQRQGYERVPN